MLKTVSKALLLVVFVTGVLIAFIAAVFFYITTPVALVTGVSPQQLDKADSVQPLLQQVNAILQRRHAEHTLEMTTQQLDSLLGVMHRAESSLTGKAHWQNDSLSVTFTLKGDRLLGTTFIGQRNMNIVLRFVTAHGLGLQEVRVGQLSFSGETVIHIAAWALNQWTETLFGDALVSRIQRVTITEKLAFIEVLPIEPVIVEYKKFKQQWQFQSPSLLAALAQDYIGRITSSGWERSAAAPSLVALLNTVFTIVKQQPADQQALHAQAAIIATAAVAGHTRVATLAGINKTQVSIPENVTATLLERNDLARHYIISAALNVLSHSAMSLAIGEFKELMDRAKGGSGYSFVDLAADMAGNALAEAVRNDEKRIWVINHLSQANNEQDLMPRVDHLQEGLSVEAFKAQFGEVDSAVYRQLIEQIAADIKAMPLYHL